MFRHNKTTLGQMDKFNRLWNKGARCMYNNSSFSTFGGHKFFSRHSNNSNISDISTPQHQQQHQKHQTNLVLQVQSQPPPQLATNGLLICPQPPSPKHRRPSCPRRPNLTVVPRYPPKETYVSAVEEVCNRLPQGGRRIKGKSSWVLKWNCPFPNLALAGRRPGQSKNSRKTGWGSSLQWTREWLWL